MFNWLKKKNKFIDPHPGAPDTNLDKWIVALRSGDFTQGDGYLARQNDEGTTQYCCMGVGCVVMGAESFLNATLMDGTTALSFEGAVKMPPRSFIEWLGLGMPEFMEHAVEINLELDVADGRIWPFEFIALDSMNDTLNLSFGEIADAIETYGVRVIEA